ncbi:hypothetical protein E2562_006226 [Oryza meyeriana var. granulata]|uniref:KIB1-4 beta-propeller domain-containing protein n=1 Tax=Oryza meyeriana var. granulata TaxID=110450 RepID=A0A6G1CNR5_9ORYZ|nr:hypothetical protein E2562_006226 [Oryza meyeriana var. granulata]
MFRRKSTYDDVWTLSGHAVHEITPRAPNPDRMRWTYHDAAETRRHVYLRAVLSGDPSSSSSQRRRSKRTVVVLVHSPCNQISFARPGDVGWTWIRVSADCFGYHDCLFDDDNNGAFVYALRRTGEARPSEQADSNPSTAPFWSVATLHRQSLPHPAPGHAPAPSGDTIFDKPYHHLLPDGAPLRDRYVVGSSRGWLVTADEVSELHLHNPITGAQFPLPPLRSLSPVRLLFRKNDLTTFYGHSVRDITPLRPNHNPQLPILKCDAAETRHHLYQRAVLSGNPSSSQGSKCIILLIHNPWNLLT